MSTHNICFHGEIRKILCGYPLLSVAMEDIKRKCIVQSYSFSLPRHRANYLKGDYGTGLCVSIRLLLHFCPEQKSIALHTHPAKGQGY